MMLRLWQRDSAFYEGYITRIYPPIASLGIDNIEGMFCENSPNQRRVAPTQPLDPTIIRAILPPC